MVLFLKSLGRLLESGKRNVDLKIAFISDLKYDLYNSLLVNRLQWPHLTALANGLHSFQKLRNVKH